MSDHSISIVPKISNYPNHKLKAIEILDWLISEDIVKSTLSDCVLSAESGYLLSDGAKKVVKNHNELPFDLLINGLHITTERQVFDTGENSVDKLICPHCKEEITYSEWDLEPWANEENDNMDCTECENSIEINDFTFEPAWGFSNLGFTFWNWTDFTEDFLEEFKQKIGCEIAIVNQHI